MVDLWRVDYRVMDVPKKKALTTNFQKFDYLEYVKKAENNQNYSYRISDLRQGYPQNAYTFYGLQSPNGYHSAKLRVYQDLIKARRIDKNNVYESER